MINYLLIGIAVTAFIYLFQIIRYGGYHKWQAHSKAATELALKDSHIDPDYMEKVRSAISNWLPLIIIVIWPLCIPLLIIGLFTKDGPTV